MSERAEVLITVKAAPEPSITYSETVCVAGVRIDGPKPEWIRLFPIPFRLLDDPNKFRKFEVVTVEVNRATHDPRSESRRPVLESLTVHGSQWSVAQRGRVLEPLVTTMCALRRGVEADINGPSLGIVRPKRVLGLRFEKHPGWSDKQQAAMNNFARQPTLLSEERTVSPLEPPRFDVRYEYVCEEDGCNSHRQRILDWELVAFQRRLATLSDNDARVEIEKRFLAMMCSSVRRTHFFVGNFADPTKRKNFSVLGMYYPPAGSDYGSTLF